jgi:signal transduction histidine kinase
MREQDGVRLPWKERVLGCWFFSNHNQNVIQPLCLASFLAGLYLILGTLYIVFSGYIVTRWVRDVAQLALMEQIKGQLFIAVTATLLFGFSYLLFRALSRREEEVGLYRDKLLGLERQASLGLLAASIAHDMRNHLMILEGVSEEMHDEAGDPKRMTSTLDAAKDALLQLAQRLQKVSEGSSGEEVQPFDLAQMVFETLRIARVHKKLRACRFEVLCPRSLPFWGNPMMIQQMLFNLLLNAADATQSQGHIRLSLKKEERRVVLTIEDNGGGISPEIAQTLFSPFVTTKEDGHGLGLLSVEACARFHQGEIEVGTSSLGGASFVVALQATPVLSSVKPEAGEGLLSFRGEA